MSESVTLTDMTMASGNDQPEPPISLKSAVWENVLGEQPVSMWVDRTRTTCRCCSAVAAYESANVIKHANAYSTPTSRCAKHWSEVEEKLSNFLFPLCLSSLLTRTHIYIILFCKIWPLFTMYDFYTTDYTSDLRGDNLTKNCTKKKKKTLKQKRHSLMHLGQLSFFGSCTFNFLKQLELFCSLAGLRSRTYTIIWFCKKLTRGTSVYFDISESC